MIMIIALKIVIQRPLSKLNSIDNDIDEIKVFMTLWSGIVEIVF